MGRKDLKNKPLVEAILEVRWELASEVSTSASGSGQVAVAGTDPHYRLLLGRLFDRFQNNYSWHEQLPTASLPDEIVGHVVQHRFRVARDGWPLIQVGPGILTVNDTHKYTWTDFGQRCNEAVVRLFEAHPNVAELRVRNVALRYVDAVPFNYESDDVFAFLRDKLKVTLSLPLGLFQDTGVVGSPRTLSWSATFQCSKPAGRVHLSFATGQKDGNPAILWETTIQTAAGDVPVMPDGFPEWLDSAHDITDDWFFKLIEGDLERRFEGD